jgi:two-component system sensor histidine kinase KdpD
MVRNAIIVNANNGLAERPAPDRSATELTRTDRPPDVFARTLAHELESSLIVLSRYIAALQEIHPPLSPQQADLAGRIARTTKRMQACLASVHALVTGEQEPTMVPTSLKDVLDDAYETVAPLIDERSPKIVLKGELPVITVDRGQLAQLLANLLANAIKFGPRRHGRVTIAVQRAGASLRISVTDQGPGIPVADRELIFEPFVRLPETSQVPGVGLGLALCRQLAENHGGTIAVSSDATEATAGTKFVLTLPDRKLVAVGA